MKWLKENWYWPLIWLACGAVGASIGWPIGEYWQTKEERRQKYWLVRSLGVNASHARRCRDWPLTKLERRFHLVFPRIRGKHHPVMAYAQFLLPNFPMVMLRAEDPFNWRFQ